MDVMINCVTSTAINSTTSISNKIVKNSTIISSSIIGPSAMLSSGLNQNTTVTYNASPNGSHATNEDINTLEAEISELQRENARVESQMLRLKSDINAIETQLNTTKRVRRFRFVEAKYLPHSLNINIFVHIFQYFPNHI